MFTILFQLPWRLVLLSFVMIVPSRLPMQLLNIGTNLKDSSGLVLLPGLPLCFWLSLKLSCLSNLFCCQSPSLYRPSVSVAYLT